MKATRSLQALALLATLAPAVVFAQSGRVTFVTGDVAIQRKDGARTPATRGAAINPGDQVISGQGGMAQLDMADRAKLAVRSNSQLEIVQYGDKPDSETPSTVRLARGAMRSFTGALTPGDRERFLMKTDIATVGVRGSGNILFAGRASECDPNRVESGGADCAIAINHTLEGGHIVAFGDLGGLASLLRAPNLSAGPGQTALVTARGEVRFIPLPAFLADSGVSPFAAARGVWETFGTEPRYFAPTDDGSAGIDFRDPVGDNGFGFKLTPGPSDLVAVDPESVRDAVIAGGFTFSGQSVPPDIRLESGGLRGYRLYRPLGPIVDVSLSGGSSQELQAYSGGGLTFLAGRWAGAVIGLSGLSAIGPPGSVHWILGDAGYPPYLADVRTGTAVYLPVINTSPTNQLNTAGTLLSARLDVNFSARLLNASLGIALPASGQNGGGTWQLVANAVPIIGGGFYASTGGRLVIVNGTGARSDTTALLVGNIEGRFVGPSMQGAALGYWFSDGTSASTANHNSVSGVVGFVGPGARASLPYREGLLSDPGGQLAGAPSRQFSFAIRPEELALDADGRAVTFSAPSDLSFERRAYALGSARVVESGSDSTAGLIWGRWSGGVATVGGTPLDLQARSLHYVFSAEQSGPVALPLSGTARYEWIGGTRPSDAQGNVGTLNQATLGVDFTRRTVDVALGLSIAGQSISADAQGIPIYRGHYFAAFRGAAGAGLLVPSLLNITCTPACPNPTGSVDGFFTGRTGAGAGLMYHLNGVAGAAAFRRPGG